MGAIRLVISDFDGTFTDSSLYVDPALVAVINRIKRDGIRFSIVTGRKYSFMHDLFASLGGLVDSFVAENGCVGFFEGRKYDISGKISRESLFYHLKANSIPYDPGEVVVSVNVSYERQLIEALKQTGNTYDLVQNIDSLMILPHNISKGTGAAWLASRYQIVPDATACIGDAQNDLSMRQACRLLGAVSNAIPELKSEADFVSQHSFGGGLREFLEFIDKRQMT
jgi:hydroxymethylpyrimidine pyrophosphatase-like HAD family hydrolase